MTTAVSFTVPYGLLTGLYYFNKRWWTSWLYHGYAGQQKKQRTDDRGLGFISGYKHIIIHWMVSKFSGNCFIYKNGHDVIGETKFIFDKREKHKF